ncbi:MAG: elongation factor 1-beta [Candidatus Marsarchaeota archaeon]|nr:elongation factor 1-beta [Candidatus Marsarchaeota archaeon]
MGSKGKVVVVAKVFPAGVETDRVKLADEIRAKLNGIAEIKKVEDEEIAFGLKALRMHMVVPEDIEGGTDVIENSVSALQGVSNVEITHVYRI